LPITRAIKAKKRGRHWRPLSLFGLRVTPCGPCPIYSTRIGKKRELRTHWQRIAKLILAKEDVLTKQPGGRVCFTAADRSLAQPARRSDSGNIGEEV